MSTTTSLSLPLIQANQAQKHITHNESLQILDALTQLRLTDISLSAPPANVAEGACYYVSGTGTDEWAGQDGKVALFDNGGWQFLAPLQGWMAWDLAQGGLLAFDGTSWVDVSSGGGSTGGATLGVNTTADSVNRFAVSSDAVLFTHDASGDQNLKLNKSGPTRTASLLFQTNWVGHAEMGTTGSNDFAIKTSADGTVFNTSLIADSATGEVSFPSGATGLTNPDFGASEIASVSHALARGADLVTNGSGHLGNGYNMPSGFVFDASRNPNLPGAIRFDGYATQTEVLSEPIGVDPNQVFRLSGYISQDDVPGDWSAFANGNRHAQSFGVAQYDADGQFIEARHHMRYRSAGIDSETVLTAPLAPGDTVVNVADASGWNDSDTAPFARGIIVFGDPALIGQFPSYSRRVEFDLFDITAVDKTNNQITLNSGLPASLANPDDPGGVWPAGTVLANSLSGESYKFAVLDGFVPPSVEDWYAATGFIGGVDESGTNDPQNFAPGTAFVRLAISANTSNASGGTSGFPDTGAAHPVRFSGLSMMPERLAAQQRVLSGLSSGRVALEVPEATFGAGSVSLVAAQSSTRQV